MLLKKTNKTTWKKTNNKETRQTRGRNILVHQLIKNLQELGLSLYYQPYFCRVQHNLQSPQQCISAPLSFCISSGKRKRKDWSKKLMLFGIILTYKITSQCGRWKASWVNSAVILSMSFNVSYGILERNERSQFKKNHYDHHKKKHKKLQNIPEVSVKVTF